MGTSHTKQEWFKKKTCFKPNMHTIVTKFDQNLEHFLFGWINFHLDKQLSAKPTLAL